MSPWWLEARASNETSAAAALEWRLVRAASFKVHQPRPRPASKQPLGLLRCELSNPSGKRRRVHSPAAPRRALGALRGRSVALETCPPPTSLMTRSCRPPRINSPPARLPGWLTSWLVS